MRLDESAAGSGTRNAERRARDCDAGLAAGEESRLLGMSSIEWCHRCQEPAPEWTSGEYLDWHVVIAAGGEYLGVLCGRCLTGEDHALAELEAVLIAA